MILETGNRERIQKAFAKGQRKLTIDRVELELEGYDRPVKYVLGGQQVEKVERWIKVKRVGGDPIGQIERTKECNLRSSTTGNLAQA